MLKELHRSEDRGRADHGWLKSFHSFSFASYYNPEKMGFGLLRVINDDLVSGGQGFPSHPHQNMEIVSIPLSGGLRHRDSVGNVAVIEHGEVQLMSAGTGVFHSEFNNSETDDVYFLQIWVMPKEHNIKPRYDQRQFRREDRIDQLQMVISPLGTDYDSIKINQNAYFYLSDLSPDKFLSVPLREKGNGLYILNLSGAIEVMGETLKSKDAMGVVGSDSLEVRATESSEVLVIEVPMSM